MREARTEEGPQARAMRLRRLSGVTRPGTGWQPELLRVTEIMMAAGPRPGFRVTGMNSEGPSASDGR